MRHLSYVVPKVASQVCSRKYIMLGRLVTNWADIVGQDLATKCQPAHISYMRRGKGDAPKVTLEIAARDADSMVISYRKDLIRERINQMFGENLIASIKLVPNQDVSLSKVRRKSTRPLTGDQKDYLSDILAPVIDENLQARLRSLGEAMLQDSRA